MGEKNSYKKKHIPLRDFGRECFTVVTSFIDQ
jgi:hypothetical protein